MMDMQELEDAMKASIPPDQDRVDVMWIAISLAMRAVGILPPIFDDEEIMAVADEVKDLLCQSRANKLTDQEWKNLAAKAEADGCDPGEIRRVTRGGMHKKWTYLEQEGLL
jgi:hypothetical protein